MEPFKIQIEVKLSDETLEAIKRIALAAIFTKLTPEDQEEIERNTFKDEEPAKAPEAPAAEPAPEIGDMPEEIAAPAQAPAAEVKEISDDEVAAKTREAVAALKKQKRSATIIRTEIFAKYGISQSVACPQERRAELLADLENIITTA